MRRKTKVLKILFIIALIIAGLYGAMLYYEQYQGEKFVIKRFATSIPEIPELQRPSMDLVNSVAIQELGRKFQADLTFYGNRTGVRILKRYTKFVRDSGCFATVLKIQTDKPENIQEFAKHLKTQYEFRQNPQWDEIASGPGFMQGYLKIAWEYGEIMK